MNMSFKKAFLFAVITSFSCQSFSQENIDFSFDPDSAEQQNEQSGSSDEGSNFNGSFSGPESGGGSQDSSGGSQGSSGGSQGSSEVNSGGSQGSQSSSDSKQKKGGSDRFVYPDVPKDIPGEEDLGVMLYPGEDREIKGKERELLKQLYQMRKLKEYRELYEDEQIQQAFDDSLDEISMLKPEMIKRLREYDKTITKAQNEPIDQVEQMMRSVQVDVNSNKPVDVYLSPGNQASIVFFDQAGNPWPLESEPQYNESAFNAQISHEKGHIVSFTLERPFSQSNAMINLEGMDTPIIIRLIGSEKKVDSRLSARIPRYGPEMNEQPQIYNQVDNASPDLLRVQNGQRLEGSLEYDVEGVNDTTAFYKNGDLYVRTKHLLLIPNPKSASTLPSGYNTYVIPAKRDLMFSVDGEYVDARVVEMDKPEIKKEKSIFKK